VDIKDEEINKMLEELREMRAKEVIADREAKETDKVILDVSMFLDNVPIEGGQHKGVTVILGKNYFVPGFDKKVEGMKKNDEREFSLPYPDDYHMKNLAGKMVEFKVKAAEVYERQMPELNDELAIVFGLKKLEELKTNIKTSLSDQKAREARQVEEREMLEKLLEKTKFGDIPQLLVENEAQTMMAELEQGVTSQGGNMADYLQSMKKSYDQLMLEMLPEAVKRVKVSLMIREIAKQEDIKVTSEELDEHVKEMKKHYHNNPEIIERLGKEEYRSYSANILASRKVLDKLREWNIIKK
jgi:trigger factor